MSTLANYSSILEIGFGLNLAISYISVFINPAVSRSEAEIARFQWWVENPERLESIGSKKLTPADFEDALSAWLYEAGRMRRAIERHRRIPTALAIIAAALLYVALWFPTVEVGNWGPLFLLLLSFGPIMGGSTYLWARTRRERDKERAACDAANKLFIKK